MIKFDRYDIKIGYLINDMILHADMVITKSISLQHFVRISTYSFDS